MYYRLPKATVLYFLAFDTGKYILDNTFAQTESERKTMYMYTYRTCGEFTSAFRFFINYFYRNYFFISIDIDVLDPAAAPGVTAPVIGGWTTRQLIELIRTVAVSADVVGADFVEYNPMLDDNARTTGLITNNMIRELLTGIAMRKKGIREPFYYHPDILGGNRTSRE